MFCPFCCYSSKRGCLRRVSGPDPTWQCLVIPTAILTSTTCRHSTYCRLHTLRPGRWSISSMATTHESTPAFVFGTLGAICWSVQLIPQIIQNHRRRSIEGLQPNFMLLWAAAGIFLAVFNTVSNFNIALLIQPQILTALSLITWCQCCTYGPRQWSAKRAILTLMPILIVLGGVEAALILGCRVGVNRRVVWPTTLCGILAGVLLCAGVSVEYYEIYKTRSVYGISFIFCGLDAAGDLFSILSVVFQRQRDYVGLGLYAAELTMWCGIFLLGGWYRLLPWLASKSSTLRRLQSRISRFSAHHDGTEDTLDSSGNSNLTVADRDDNGFTRSVQRDNEDIISMSVFRTASISTTSSRQRRAPQVPQEA
jgi:predicted membrane protein